VGSSMEKAYSSGGRRGYNRPQNHKTVVARR
jgi:hypothetical protein